MLNTELTGIVLSADDVSTVENVSNTEDVMNTRTIANTANTASVKDLSTVLSVGNVKTVECVRTMDNVRTTRTVRITPGTSNVNNTEYVRGSTMSVPTRVRIPVSLLAGIDPCTSKGVEKPMTPKFEYQKKYPCPDCGAPDTLSASDVKRGYHCYKCSAIAEGSMAYE